MIWMRLTKKDGTRVWWTPAPGTQIEELPEREDTPERSMILTPERVVQIRVNEKAASIIGVLAALKMGEANSFGIEWKSTVDPVHFVE